MTPPRPATKTLLLLALALACFWATAEPRPPGVVIDHSPAASGRYIGSPSIAVWTNGNYIASHDFFGPGTTHDLTALFASADAGLTWNRLGEVQGQFWSSLFVHRGGLYLFGTSKQNGFVVIRRSVDGGKTWTSPTTPRTGLLRADAQFHCAPVPVIEHGGRLWRAMEDCMGPAGWGKQFRSFMMSAPVGADLLDAANWVSSNPVGRDPAWLGGHFGGWLEGNAVVSPEGGIVTVLRADYREGPEKAAILKISPDGARADFSPETGFVDFPGGCKKFTIRFDPVSRLYWALSNHVPLRDRGPSPDRIRNTLALVSSPDLRSWTVRAVVASHPDSAKHGFHYVDWLFEGEDIIAVVRTAFDDETGGARNQHDANYLTFQRIRDFRKQSAPSANP